MDRQSDLIRGTRAKFIIFKFVTQIFTIFLPLKVLFLCMFNYTYIYKPSKNLHGIVLWKANRFTSFIYIIQILWRISIYKRINQTDIYIYMSWIFLDFLIPPARPFLVWAYFINMLYNKGFARTVGNFELYLNHNTNVHLWLLMLDGNS